MEIRKITITELQKAVNEATAKIIDVRPVDAYNGWKLNGEQRGGHIAGAKSLPIQWIKYMDWIEMVRHKYIQPADNIIIYGYSENDSQKVAERFIKSGYNNISVYNYFVNEWSANPELPMQKLERYRHLVSAHWVHQLISGEKPDEYENDKFIVVHAHYRNRNAYLTGHIPGAIDMDTLALEAPETWNRRSPEELKAALETHGISSDTTVVLYGKFMFPNNADEFPGSAAGDIGAIRIALIMMYAGVKDVRVLNGGFQSWQDAGYQIDTDDVPKKPIADFGLPIPQKSELIVDIDKAKEMLKATDAELVCVRSYPEYIGEVSGYNYIQAKGRIPGAIFANCGSDAYHMENYRNFDHTTREFHEIEQIWINSGITPDKHLAFYCGTGWRGSEAWFNAWLMGWPKVSVYDGGWFEWSSNPENPYETGIPK
ncbi:MAG: sulfurtransferase [Bacteroidales bacterium]|nr:sulfurtransferase [Bacteroidales bacterium]